MKEIYNKYKQRANKEIEVALEEAERVRLSLEATSPSEPTSFLVKKLTDSSKCLREARKLLESPKAECVSILKKRVTEIAVIFNTYKSFKRDLNELKVKLNDCLARLDKLEGDFAYLTNPERFPETYQKSLEEIKRRNKFNSDIRQMTSKIFEEVEKERAARSVFSKKWHKYLTKDYLPILKFAEPSVEIKFVNESEDTLLPPIFHDSFNESPGRKRKNSSRKGSENEDLRVSEAIEENRKLKEQLKMLYVDTEEDNGERRKIDILQSKIKELEIDLNVKRKCAEEATDKFKRIEKKLYQKGHEIDQLMETQQKMAVEFENHIKQLKDKFKKKNFEYNNALKSVNLSCFVCNQQAHTGIEYKNYSDYVQGFNDKIKGINNRKESLENRVVELTRSFVTVKRILFNHVGQIKETKSSSKQREYDDYKKRVKDLEEHIKKIDSEREKSKRKAKDVEKHKMSLESEIMRLKEEIKSTYIPKLESLRSISVHDKKAIENLQSKTVSLEEEIDQNKHKIRELANKNRKLEEEGTKMALNQSDNIALIDELQTKLTAQEEETDSLAAKLEDKAELITALEEELKENDKKMSEQLEENISDLEADKKRMEEEFEAKLKLASKKQDLEVERLTEACELANIEVEKLSVENQHLINQIEKLNEQVSTMKTTNNPSEAKGKFDSLVEENDSLKKKLKEVENTLIQSKKGFEFETENTYSQILSEKLSSQFMSGKNEEIANFISNSREFISLKKSEKGNICLFLPFSQGVYCLVNLAEEGNSASRYFKMDCILNLDSFSEEIKELLV